MNAQDIITIALGVLAASYILWRLVRRRLASTCCGERECPAARRMLDGLGKPSE